VGQLHELILGKLGVSASSGRSRCLTATAFYRLRGALVDLTGREREALAPSTPLRVAMPLGRRRTLWPALSDRLALSLPPLGRGQWFVQATMVGGVAAFFGGLIVGGWFWPGLWAGYAAAAVLAWLVTRPLAVFPDGKVGTVGDLARATAYRNAGRLARELEEVDGRETWAALVRLISWQLGVRESDVRLETRFVEDLNC
jgi:hypothetical protein